MTRSIGDFDVTWAGEFVQAKRKSRPRHVYEFSVSLDRATIDRLYWVGPAVITDGPKNALRDTEQYEVEARKAADEFLRLEQGGGAPTV
jgi:hypothetical protein